jgi:NADPH:quinone reductase-like Zn-dependent oxidoreductase
MKTWALIVERADLSSTKLVDAAAMRPTSGQALLRVERVGLTTNNVTYCALGDTLRYWDYFPSQIPGMGHIPLWGYAEVVATETDVLQRHDRVFGYLPSASHLLVTPSPLGADRFRDHAAHRAGLMPIYNDYTVVTGVPRSPERENVTALYRPLFMTSFAFEAFAAANEWFGAVRLLISSASSKTGYGIAHLAHRRGGIEIVGITSPANVAFSEQLGCYDTVITYDDVEALPTVTTLYADVAGDPGLRRRIHRHLAGNLTHDAVLGVSHISSPTSLGIEELVDPKPTVFGAFDYLLTPAMQQEIARRYRSAWDDFQTLLRDNLDIVTAAGPKALEEHWIRLQGGSVDPRQGVIVTFPNDDAASVPTTSGS